MNPETLKRLRDMARVYAERTVCDLPLAMPDDMVKVALTSAIRAAYLNGADVGYVARVAEEKKL
jgi:hypothetical protein